MSYARLKIYSVDASNNSTLLTGIKSIQYSQNLNSPSTMTIVLNNIGGKRNDVTERQFKIKVDAIAPKMNWLSANPVNWIFFGRVTSIELSATDCVITAMDTLNLLSYEIISKNPTSLTNGEDSASIIKEIIGGSSYSIGLEKIIGETKIKMSSGLNLIGKSRLSAIQTILSQLNVSPKKFRFYASKDSESVAMEELPDPFDSTAFHYLAGRVPYTTAPLDFYPSMIDRIEDNDDIINMVTVKNSEFGIDVTVPSIAPSNVIQKLYTDSTITDESQARLFAQQILRQQGMSKMKWLVEGMPSTFDITTGELIEFQSKEGGLSGQHMVFNISYRFAPSAIFCKMTVGRQNSDLLTTLQFANQLNS
tara:strand:+ start:20512 stop:21603 length:1092 start_codon:yes stop_codon:yes gene_type:complete